MSSSIYQRIRSNPKFQALEIRRGRFAALLSAIVLIGYYSFMMIVAFAPSLLHTPVSEGAAMSIGFPVGVAIIVISWLLTGVYVWRANGEFDRLNAEIIKEASK